MKIPYKLNIIKKKEDTSKEKQEQCKITSNLMAVQKKKAT
jgi:hypothetical protein